ncbi:hypothetical protein Cni_G08535 [Canna indica]|uniref:Uncharacterized protein n=1 Tax=Canna indica TaxID=4628 RepID=A0AAQ3K2B5_9LILI|nr:hypothetical protein Cni_G08535 [Canna indica]
MRSSVGDVAYKAVVASLGAATLYLGGLFSVNLYRGFSWFNAQSKLEKEKTEE